MVGVFGICFRNGWYCYIVTWLLSQVTKNGCKMVSAAPITVGKAIVDSQCFPLSLAAVSLVMNS